MIYHFLPKYDILSLSILFIDCNCYHYCKTTVGIVESFPRLEIRPKALLSINLFTWIFNVSHKSNINIQGKRTIHKSYKQNTDVV